MSSLNSQDSQPWMLYRIASRLWSSVEKTLLVAVQDLIYWLRDIRLIILYMIMVAFLFWMQKPTITMIVQTGYAASIGITPLLFSSVLNQLVLGSLYVAMLSNTPFKNENLFLVVSRTGRTTWIAGQIVFIIFVTCIFCVALYSTSFLLLAPYTSLEIDDWGSIVDTLAYTDADISFGITYPVDVTVITGLTPSEAILLQAVLQFSCYLLIGLCMFFFGLYANRKFGVFSGLAIVLLDLTVSNTLPFAALNYSPVSMVRLSVLDYTGGYMMYHPSPAWALSFMIGASAIVIIASLAFSRRAPMELSAAVL